MTLPQMPFKARGLDEGPFADIPPHGVGFSPEGRMGRFGNRPKAFAYFPDARNGLPHRGRSSVHDLLFQSHSTFKFYCSRRASTSSRL